MKKDGSSVKAGVPDDAFPAFADVRNVGEAHYQAIAKGKSGRFIICSGVSTTVSLEDAPQIADVSATDLFQPADGRLPPLRVPSDQGQGSGGQAGHKPGGQGLQAQRQEGRDGVGH